MRSLHPTATIEALLLPPDPNSFFTTPRSELEFDIAQNGIIGELRHRSMVSTADIRTPSYARGQDTVLNRQSVSIVGAEDLDYVSDHLGLKADTILEDAAEAAQLDQDTMLTLLAADLRVSADTLTAQPSRITRLFLAQCLGANILLGNFQGTADSPEFRTIDRGTDIGPYDPGKQKFTDATVMITRPNAPCHSVARETKQRYPVDIADLDKKLLSALQGRRGFVGMVAKGGKMAVGQFVQFIPLGER